MKRVLHSLTYLSFLAIGISQVQAQITNPAPYCAATYDGGEFYVPRYITNVKVGTLSNETGDTHFEAPHYVYYNNIAAPDLQKGQSYTITLGHDGGTIQFLCAFIDFNGNNTFDLPQEMILGKYILDEEGVPNPSTAQFTVPANAVNGVTRMRVMIFGDDKYTWEEGNTDFLACTAYDGGFIDWGETEDYNVNITGGATAGIESADFSALQISPNPVVDFINVTESMRGADVEILSIDGKRLLFVESVAVDKIDVSTLSKGLAIVRLSSKDKVFSQSIVIQ